MESMVVRVVSKHQTVSFWPNSVNKGYKESGIKATQRSIRGTVCFLGSGFSCDLARCWRYSSVELKACVVKINEAGGAERRILTMILVGMYPALRYTTSVINSSENI